LDSTKKQTLGVSSRGKPNNDTLESTTNLRLESSALGKGINKAVYSSAIARDWWEPYVESIAQPFQPWKGTTWCFRSTRQRGVKPYGLMLTKVHKAASSTAAGVTMRIADRKRLNVSKNACLQYCEHWFSLRNHHSQRDRSKSFLWATVRQPHSRALSSFFFYQEQEGAEEQLSHLEKQVGNQLRQIRKRDGGEETRKGKVQEGGEFFGNLGLDNSIVTKDPETLAFEHIQKRVLQWYDFVAVTERWEESMVVMKFLLNLEYADMIVLKSKESGGYAGSWADRVCRKIPKATASPAAQEYLQTKFRQSNADYLLYAAVNRSLDLTIELLGEERIEDGLREFRLLQALAQDNCLSKAVFPCSANGTFQHGLKKDCYKKDWGCGYLCVDRVLDEYASQKSNGRQQENITLVY
jgi:hypothetical protein